MALGMAAALALSAAGCASQGSGSGDGGNSSQNEGANAGSGNADAGNNGNDAKNSGDEGAGEKKPLKIGFAWRSLDEGATQWWNGTEAAIAEYNAGDNPYEIEYFFVNSDQDVDQQISDVESLIVREPDVICLHAIDVDGSVPAFEACTDAGIPVIIYGYPVNYDKAECEFKTIDHYRAGQLQAEWMNSWLAEHPDETVKVGYILGLPGVTDMDVRMNGFLENVDKDRVEVVATKNCDFNASLAQSTAEDWIQAFPEMNCIVACNDEMAVGALQAFKASNIDGLVLGLDGGASALQEIADGNMSATVKFDFMVMATEGLKLAIGVATGEYTEPVCDVTGNSCVLIDQSNAAEYMAE